MVSNKHQESPKVSIVSPYYNRERFVSDSIKSLIEQSYNNLEIILINDGSTDNTLSELMKFSNDPRVIILNHENWGLTRSLIHAFEIASGEYIAVHGSGDISHRERVSKQARFLNEHPCTGAVGAYYINQNLVTGEIEERKISALIPLTRSTPFEHGVIMYRRSAYVRAGGYRAFFQYSQCIDLYLRLMEVSKMDVVPDVLYTRYVRTDGCEGDVAKRIIQLHYREIALQCAHLRSVGSPDLVERFNLNAWVGRKRSRRVARGLHHLAILAKKRNNNELAHVYLNMSLSEKITFRGILVAILIYTNII